jgi:hypothetical protein
MRGQYIVTLILSFFMASCMTQGRGKAPLKSANGATPSEKGLSIRGHEALNFKNIVQESCALPSGDLVSLDKLRCIYQVDDDGRGNFFVSRSCTCFMADKETKFTNEKSVFDVSEIMENAGIGVPGEIRGQRIYLVSNLVCSGNNPDNSSCLADPQ